MKIAFSFIVLTLLSISSSAQVKTDAWLKDLLFLKASPFLKNVLSKTDSFQYQIIYTQINRNKKNNPLFTNYFFNVDRNRYFNPASTVKLPTVLVALEKLNELKNKGINKYSAMLTDSGYVGQTKAYTDSSAQDRLPSIAHYIKKIFLTSDNDAYNRLYEFSGQEQLNKTLWDKGYKGVRITRRFVTMTEEQNKYSNAIRFMNKNKVVYQQPLTYSNVQFDFNKTFLIGKAHWNRNDSLINSPMDFTRHNNLALEDLQQMLQSVIFPESIHSSRRFNLSKDDYRFLYYYMSALPFESDFPRYDTSEFFDSYTKFFYKSGKQKIPSHIRIFNKPGWSYGFLTDAAYVVDFKNNIEFMLSAVIYVNADGVLNDNKYEYNQVGYPFFNEVYNIIYQFEKERRRTYSPFIKTFLYSGTLRGYEFD